MRAAAGPADGKWSLCVSPPPQNPPGVPGKGCLDAMGVTVGWECSSRSPKICLGEMARDEFHVVEIVLAEGGPRSPVPLATLKPSVLPMVSAQGWGLPWGGGAATGGCYHLPLFQATLMGVELTPPVTFHLRAGSGPVYISGQHVSSKYWGTTAPCPLLGSGGSARCSPSDVQPVLG